MWLAVIVQPESSFSIVSVTFVEMLSGVRFPLPNWADKAMEKHPACAAAINSSGFVPGAFSNLVVNEYEELFNTPPGADIVPLPSFNPPFQTALALRCMTFSFENQIKSPRHCRRNQFSPSQARGTADWNLIVPGKKTAWGRRFYANEQRRDRTTNHASVEIRTAQVKPTQWTLQLAVAFAQLRRAVRAILPRIGHPGSRA